MEQLHISYQPKEDRLVFILEQDGQRVVLRFTRRFTLLLLNTIEQYVLADPIVKQQSDPANKDNVLAFFKDGAAQQSQFKPTPLNAEQLSSMADDYVLAVATAISEQRKLAIHCDNGKTLTLGINSPMALTLKNMLMKVSEQAQWALSETKLPSQDVQVHYKASMRAN